MQTVWTFDKSVEADLAKTHLESQGISVVLDDYHVVSANWLRSGAMGGIKLKVERQHVATATGLLKRLMRDLASACDTADADEACLACGHEMLPDEEACSSCGWTFHD